LKAALDAAVASGDPQRWLDASEAVDTFRGSSSEAAQAWQAVLATLSRSGSTRPDRTVQNVFDELAESGTDAERVAAAFGNTLDANLESAESRARLVSSAIAELLTVFDLDPASEQVQFLVSRLGELETEITRLKGQQDQ